KTGALSMLLRGYDRVVDTSLERVLAMTPQTVPFWGGTTYSNLIYMAIPRILWPDKPEYGSNLVQFGHLYNYTLDDDYQTSVAYSYLTEGYMNFGYLGLYVTAILFAVLLCSMEVLSIYFLEKPNLFSVPIFLLPLLSYSSDFSSMLSTCVTIAAIA